jgi:hypothetical protein
VESIETEATPPPVVESSNTKDIRSSDYKAIVPALPYHQGKFLLQTLQ